MRERNERLQMDEYAGELLHEEQFGEVADDRKDHSRQCEEARDESDSGGESSVFGQQQRVVGRGLLQVAGKYHDDVE
jgi:hypothetical protein